MFLTHKKTGDLIRVETLDELTDPLTLQIKGRDQAGEEEQEPEWYSKDELAFPSGEPLPKCWTDPSYRMAGPVRLQPTRNHQ